jgi:hypothetical protein
MYRRIGLENDEAPMSNDEEMDEIRMTNNDGLSQRACRLETCQLPGPDESRHIQMLRPAATIRAITLTPIEM